MAGNIIELIDLTKKYGSFIAVNQLNLTIRKGEIFGLLGPNGAGKSTTILMMLGLTEPSAGSVRINGINPATDPIRVKKKVGYLPEDVGFYEDMSGLDNLIFTARLNGIPKTEAEEKSRQLLDRVGLTDQIEKRTGKYSRGMRQRLGLADVLIKNPEVIILDEPTLGIDPTGVREFLELILSLSREDGLTVLISSHHLHHVQQICDRVGLFINGKLIAEGDIHSLSQNLFPETLHVIEVGIKMTPNPDQSTPGNLENILLEIDGVKSIDVKNDLLQIDCTRDVTTEIAKAIVESGAGLNFLSRKEYGLDDIYNRYFEGGAYHE